MGTFRDIMSDFTAQPAIRQGTQKPKAWIILLFLLLAYYPAATFSAVPAPPTGLCLSPGEICTSTLSFGKTTSPSIVAPQKVDTNNFHPGFYISVGQTSAPAASVFSIAANKPAIIGAKRIYTWRHLEPVEGKYNFSRIEEDLAYLQSIGKRLWIQVLANQFNGARNPNTPSYMWQNPVYGCSSEFSGNYQRGVQEGGWIACYWNDNLSNKLRALLTALGNRFNSEPYFEGISLSETAIDTASAKLDPTYSATKVQTAFQGNALAAKKAFPNKIVMQMVNFAPYDIGSFAAWLVRNGIGIGSPDTLLSNTYLKTNTYPQYLKHHDVVPTAPDVQWGNYTKINSDLGRANTAEELLTGVIQLTNPWYMFWQTRDPYFVNDVLPLITNQAKSLPSALEFYNSSI